MDTIPLLLKKLHALFSVHPEKQSKRPKTTIPSIPCLAHNSFVRLQHVDSRYGAFVCTEYSMNFVAQIRDFYFGVKLILLVVYKLSKIPVAQPN